MVLHHSRLRLIKPRSAWTHFKSHCAHGPTENRSPKRVSALWSQLEASEKAVFYKMYEADCERYTNDVRAMRGTAPGSTKSRNMSAYNFFVRSESTASGATESDFATRAQAIASKWRALNKEERVPYELLAQNDAARYATVRELRRTTRVRYPSRYLSKRPSNSAQ